MDELVLDAPEAPVIVITNIGGDLRLAGWDQNQVQATSDDEQSLSLTADSQTGQFNVSAGSDCNLHVPRKASIKLKQAGGDAKLKNVDGSLDIEFTGGDLTLRQVGSATIAKIGGDLSAKKVTGSLTFGASGDASIADVSGDVQGRTGGDLYVRDVGGGVRLTAGGDVMVSCGFYAGLAYEVKSGSDIVCRVPPDASARLTVRSGGDIGVDAPGARIEGGPRNKTITLGKGAAEASLTAGGDVSIAVQVAEGETLSDMGETFGKDFGVIADELSSKFEQIESQMAEVEKQINDRLSQIEFGGASSRTGDELSLHIRQEIEKAMGQARKNSANLRSRVEARVMAAEQRAERQADKQERQADKRRKATSFTFKWDPAGRPPTPPAPPKPPAPAVSDEERMAVLKMLEQGKISVEQAEKLLAALEGAGK